MYLISDLWAPSLGFIQVILQATRPTGNLYDTIECLPSQARLKEDVRLDQVWCANATSFALSAYHILRIAL
jgi:hypothetical protein